jgi:hypothetical protein
MFSPQRTAFRGHRARVPRLAVGALALFLPLFVCAACNAQEPGTMPKEALRAFYADRSADHRMHTFRLHSVDQQLQIFLYGNQVIHPPTIYLADCFALGGSEAVAVLRSRLSARVTDLDIRDMANLLLAIQRSGTYDVRADEALRRLLDDRISAMVDGGWKGFAKTYSNAIASDEGSPRRADDRCSVGLPN